MSEQQRQRLSALVDGELDAGLSAATVAALESNADLAASWERYHLIGTALRREATRPEYRGIAVAVRDRLQSEPTVLAPSRSRPGPKRGAGPILGIGLAAGAAFLAVFALPQLFHPAQPGGAASGPSVASAPLPQQFRLGGDGRRWHLDQPGLESKLDRFLVNHQVRSPATGVKGFLPYATVVGYEAGR